MQVSTVTQLTRGIKQIINTSLGRTKETQLTPDDLRKFKKSFDGLGSDRNALELKTKLSEALWKECESTADKLSEKQLVSNLGSGFTSEGFPITVASIANGIDLTLRPKKTDSGLEFDPGCIFPGGAPQNVMLNIFAQGGNAQALWVVGNGELAEIFLRLNEQYGLKIPEDQRFPIGRDQALHLFFTNPDLGLEVRVIQPSPEFTAEEIKEYIARLDEMTKPRSGILVISSRPPSNASPEFQPNLIKIGVKNKQFIVVDTKPDQLRNKAYLNALLNSERIDLLKVDIDELAIILESLGEKVNKQELEANPKEVNQMAQRIMDKFPNINLIMVSKGKYGVDLCIKDGVNLHASIPNEKATPVSTVGCGDAGLAAFCATLAYNLSFSELLAGIYSPYVAEIIHEALKNFAETGGAKAMQPSNVVTLEQIREMTKEFGQSRITYI